MNRPLSHVGVCLSLIILWSGTALPSYAQQVQLNVPEVVLTDIVFDIQLDATLADSLLPAPLDVRVNGESYPITYTGEVATVKATVASRGSVTVEARYHTATIAQTETRAIPGWLSILPPVIVIAIALVTKRVIPSLFLGIWVGAIFAIGFSFYGVGMGLLDAFEVYIKNAVTDGDHASIMLFTFMIGGMVGIVSKNGGMQGIVEIIARWAQTPKRGQLSTAFIGFAIFFDDYANTLVVGKTMRPVLDRLRVSREKLAYLVDSTAAPVATVAFVTTWIGFQVGLIGDAVGQIDGYDEAAYSIFLNSLPYSFYPWMAIVFVLAVALMGRDFGPMYKAEVRARSTGQVASPNAKIESTKHSTDALKFKEDQPLRAINALLPIIVLVGGVVVGLFVTGEGSNLRDIIGSADSYKSLMWASLAAVLTAAVLSIVQRILTLEEVVESWFAGLRAMLFAMIILIMAWALSDITNVLHTADYLVSVLGSTIPVGTLPTLVFILAALTAFSTGSSWSTMGILMPLVIPLIWAVLLANDMADPAHYYIVYATASCVLGGAVLGDHCSPISDTTILSSMASSCDHIDHVRTQLPYALTVGTVSILLGTLPAGFGFPWWISMALGIGVLLTTLRFVGKPVPDYDPAMAEA